MCDLHPHDGDAVEIGTDVESILDEIVVALTNSRIYASDHPRVKRSLETLVCALDRRLEGRQIPRLEIGAADGYLFHARRPLLGASLSALRLLRPLRELEAGGFQLDRGTTVEDLRTFVDVLGARELESDNWLEANRLLTSRGCRRIRLTAPRRSPAELDITYDMDTPDEDETQTLPNVDAQALGTIDVPVSLWQDIVDLLQSQMISACRAETFSVDETRGLVEAMLEQITKDPKSMLHVARYERYDAFTFGHSIRVAVLALDFARTLTQHTRLLHRVGVSALLHDIGKARVPFEILYSRGRLSPEERRLMDTHTVHGGEILLGLPDADEMSVAVAFGHHGNRHQDAAHRLLPQSAITKLVRICDIYEALTAVRPYKDRMSPLRAFRIMMSMNELDKKLLRAFIDHNGIYPVGSRVRLATGETGTVAAQSTSLPHPVVEIETDAEGVCLDEPLRRDLSSDPPSLRTDVETCDAAVKTAG